MPRSEYSETAKRLRSATVQNLRATLDELESSQMDEGYHFARRIETLLDLYIGTLPKSYRDDGVDS